MTIIYLIIAWLLIMAIYMLWMKFREDRLHGRSFLNFGDFNFLILAITSLLFTWITFSIIAPEPKFSDVDSQLEFGEKTNQPRLITNALWQKINSSPQNIDYHFQLVENHFKQDKKSLSKIDLRAYVAEANSIYNYYTEQTEKENDSVANDIGYLMLANFSLESNRNNNSSDRDDNAFFYLRQVKNKELKYLNYTAGRILLYEAGPEASTANFLSEVEANGYKKGAWENLALIYDASGNKGELKKLIYNSESVQSVPEEIRYKEYFLNHDYFLFYKLKFSKIVSSLQIWGILGALLILFTWLFFLRKLSFLAPIKWKHFFLAIGIGSVLAMASLLLYQFYHHVLHFWTNGNIGNDFLFSFLGIGMIEELVKLIPFLILLRFTKIINRPIDYLLIASAAGLGFAFFENLIYISQYGLEVIHTRALTASVSHMASSAIAAYGFVLVKFRHPKKPWLIPLFFILAAFAHGFYDFWLLNEKVHSLAIVTLFFFLSEILVYVSFLNNALNQSIDGKNSSKANDFNTSRLASLIAGTLVFVFILEYVGTCFISGTAISNRTIMSSFLSGGYLIFFLSVRLSNIVIIPNEWMPIEFFSGLLPSEILGNTKKINKNRIVGGTLNFTPDNSSGIIISQLPFVGTVKKRMTISKYPDWFEIETTVPLLVGKNKTNTLYIKTKNPTDKIVKNEITLVEIFVRFENFGVSNLVFFDRANVR